MWRDNLDELVVKRSLRRQARLLAVALLYGITFSCCAEEECEGKEAEDVRALISWIQIQAVYCIYDPYPFNCIATVAAEGQRRRNEFSAPCRALFDDLANPPSSSGGSGGGGVTCAGSVCCDGTGCYD
jgi:hypothetical protein